LEPDDSNSSGLKAVDDFTKERKEDFTQSFFLSLGRGGGGGGRRDWIG